MTPRLAQRPRADRALERLYRRHAADVYRYALAVLRNSADAEDVTQTTFMNAYRALERGEEPRAPHNWLIAIAHNVCRQRFRSAARRPSEVALEDDVADHFVEDEDSGPSPEDIRRALGHLAFNQRAALVMRELEGRSYAEIADMLGISVSAVETLIFRARRALREQLEGGLTCREAELAISKQLDGRLSRAEKGQLRAHLRECAECASFARRQRATRAALRSLGTIPLPPSLAGLFGGGGGVAAGVGVAAKAVAVVAAAAVASGVGYVGSERFASHPRLHREPPAATTIAPPARTPAPPAVSQEHVVRVVPSRPAPHRRAAPSHARHRVHPAHRTAPAAPPARARAAAAPPAARAAHPAAPGRAKPKHEGRPAPKHDRLPQQGRAAEAHGHAAAQHSHGPPPGRGSANGPPASAQQPPRAQPAQSQQRGRSPGGKPDTPNGNGNGGGSLPVVGGEAPTTVPDLPTLPDQAAPAVTSSTPATPASPGKKKSASFAGGRGLLP